MRELRRVALGAGLLAQLASAVAGVLPWPALPVVAVLYVVAVRTVERAGEGRARLLNAIATAVALLLAVALLPGASPDRDSLRSTLGLLLVLIQIPHGLTWRTRREVQTGLAMAAALLVLGASFAPDILVGLPLLAGWALLVAGIVLCAEQRMREGAAIVVAGGRRPPLLAATALALLLGLAAFLLVPVPQTPARRSAVPGLSSGAGASRSSSSYSASRLDLRVRGALSDHPVLEVPADSAPLWRSQVFGFYGGQAWSSTSGQLRLVPGPPWTVGPDTEGTRSDRAVRRGAADSTVWVPAEPVALDGDAGVALVSDGAGTIRSGGNLRSYTVLSSPQVRDPTLLRAAGSDDNVAAIWTQLPPTLPDRVRALSAQLTGAAPTRFDAVSAVAAWLRTHATYTLDSPVPGPGEDAVDRFLFVDHVGFCEQFAAAETVLLRAAGIPARLATGLAAGERTGARRVFRERNLHAWVEVYYPGVGWSPSDPTAGVALASGGGLSVRQRLATTLTTFVRRAESGPGGRAGLAVLLVLAAVGVAVLARLYRPRRRSAPLTAGTQLPSRRAGPALSAFLRYDERLGDRRRRPNESLAELARRLDPEPRSALAVVEAECYGAEPPPDAEHAAALLDRLQPLP